MSSAHVNPPAALSPQARALVDQADAKWEQCSLSSIEVGELLVEISGEVEDIAGAQHLVPMLARLENAIADESGAASEAARLLFAAVEAQSRYAPHAFARD